MEKKDYYGVSGYKNLLRDANSRGIINTDNGALNKYRQEREIRFKLNNLIEEYTEIKSEISEIKAMLTLLLKKA